MTFELINLNNWERTEYFNHYFNDVTCSYSLTINLNVTSLQKFRIYPTMIWLLTNTVNEMIEFRTSLRPEGLGYFTDMHPSYTIFNKENRNFSDIWTEFDADYSSFLAQYEQDVKEYSTSKSFQPKPGRPENTFDISMLPWVTFTAFNLNIYGEGKYLLPIFTMGKILSEGEKQMLPLAIQVHHAVCDGYHVGAFVQSLQSKILAFESVQTIKETS